MPEPGQAGHPQAVLGTPQGVSEDTSGGVWGHLWGCPLLLGGHITHRGSEQQGGRETWSQEGSLHCHCSKAGSSKAAAGYGRCGAG